MDLSGLLNVLVFTGIFASIYALLSLGLNLQWGYTGLCNVGFELASRTLPARL